MVPAMSRSSFHKALVVSASSAAELGEAPASRIVIVDDEALAAAGPRVTIACLPLVPGERTARPDNLTARCAGGCGCIVQFRPHAPPEARTTCLQCCGLA